MLTAQQVRELLATINGIISLYSIVLILNIYWLYHTKKAKGQINGEKDFGLIWLAVAFFCWTMTGIISVNYPGQSSIVSFLSIGNDGVFICSFAFFDHGIEFLSKRNHRKNFFLTVAILTAILICINLFLIGVGFELYANYIEAVYTTLMLSGFAGILFNSFFARKLYGIAFIALSVVCLVVFSQLAGLFSLTGNQIVENAIYIASQSLLLTIVIALSFSWIIEKIEEKFDVDANTKGKRIVEEFVENIKGLKSYLNDKIANNEIEVVFLALKEYYKDNLDKKNLNTVIIRMCQYNQIQLQLRNGTIEKSDARRELNEITEIMLNLTNTL